MWTEHIGIGWVLELKDRTYPSTFQLFATETISKEPASLLPYQNLPCLRSSFSLHTGLFQPHFLGSVPHSTSESSFQTQISTTTSPAQQTAPFFQLYTGLPPGLPCTQLILLDAAPRFFCCLPLLLVAQLT